MGNRAVFLDRDGLICEDIHYMSSPDQFKLLPGVAEGIRLLNEEGLKVIVVTNQSGIARGYFTAKDLEKIHKKMIEELRKKGAKINDIYCCPHHPNDGCECRKPKPGLLLKAAEEHDLDLKICFMVGDRQLDADAGRRAGCKTVSVLSPESEDKLESDHIVEDLFEAAQIVIREIGKGVHEHRKSERKEIETAERDEDIYRFRQIE